jgi:hypothetical protein
MPLPAYKPILDLGLEINGWLNVNVVYGSYRFERQYPQRYGWVVSILLINLEFFAHSFDILFASDRSLHITLKLGIVKNW